MVGSKQVIVRKGIIDTLLDYLFKMIWYEINLYCFF
jgi:hypothetical protein